MAIGFGLIVVIVLLVVVIGVVGFIVGVYNKLVTMRNRYKNAYAQIDVQLKRRYDLIPNLVETAKGYIKHERETLEAVTAARNNRCAGDRTRARPARGAARLRERRGCRTDRSTGPADSNLPARPQPHRTGRRGDARARRDRRAARAARRARRRAGRRARECGDGGALLSERRRRAA